MDGRDMLKELAKRAKNRLSGKQGKKQDNIRYINQKNVIETVLIKEDTAFNQKVKEIVEKDSIYPLNELINFAYYKTLSTEQKEKYFIDLALKYRKEKERILQEKYKQLNA